MQSDLVSACKATDYVAHVNGGVVVIRIGYHSQVVDKLLAVMNAGNGAFITAWNPFSKCLSTEANIQVCVAFVEGEGRGRAGQWPPEPSVLAFGN
jgi:hypothetical protein